jgi:hypothetical protein
VYVNAHGSQQSFAGEAKSPEAVTIDEGAETKLTDQQAPNARAWNLNHLEQHQDRQEITSHKQQKGVIRTTERSVT